MKTIRITFTREVQFNKIIEVSDAIAKKALALDGVDLNEPRSYPDKTGWSLITEDLTDTDDVYDFGDEVTMLSVELYKKPEKK